MLFSCWPDSFYEVIRYESIARCAEAFCAPVERLLDKHGLTIANISIAIADAGALEHTQALGLSCEVELED